MQTITEKDIAKLLRSPEFDPDWYRASFPDVAQGDIDPAVHYLAYGARMWRDPGPDFSAAFARIAYRMLPHHEPLSRLRYLEAKGAGARPPPDDRLVLLAAHEVARRGDHARAIALAERHLPAELAFCIDVLRANAALSMGDEAEWLRRINAYLEHYGMSGFGLSGGEGTVFDRLASPRAAAITGGPMVSVIMPAWNAAATVHRAAASILDQTWRNIELLIVDDASQDGTWAALQEIAASDGRVRILRNKVNVGPYVSKNIALSMAQGEWITGLDADDWSLPDRIARQMAYVTERGGADCGCVFSCIRLLETGDVTFLSRVSEKRPDGVLTLHPITLLLPRHILRDKLGSWDSARFGADNELIKRANMLLDGALGQVFTPCMFYMDTPGSLTNHPETAFNVDLGMSPLRRAYRETWLNWQAEEMHLDNLHCMFPPYERRYPIPEGAEVPLADVLQALPCAQDVAADEQNGAQT